MENDAMRRREEDAVSVFFLLPCVPFGGGAPGVEKGIGGGEKREGGVKFEARKEWFSLVNDETQSIDDDVLWLVDEALLASNPIREWRFDLQILLKLFLLAFPVRVLFLEADDDGLRTVDGSRNWGFYRARVKKGQN